jgi:hypothetical protein
VPGYYSAPAGELAYMAQRQKPDSPPDVTPVESKWKLRPDDVARRAHELYEARGRGEGRDLDDWLQAEEELRRKGDEKQGREEGER